MTHKFLASTSKNADAEVLVSRPNFDTVAEGLAKQMINVIVFTSNANAYAVELGWIREIFTLGHVTPVPHASSAIAGVVNFHGAIVSVIDIRGLSTSGQEANACQGESALLIEVNRSQAALYVGVIDEIASLQVSDSPGQVIDSQHRNAQVLRPQELFSKIMQSPVTGTRLDSLK